MLDRFLRGPLELAMRSFPAVLLTGPRQSGKTTLLRDGFGASHRYASLDDPDVLARIAADPRAFLDEIGSPCILDEIQHAPALLQYLKSRIDANHKPGRYLLTGSQTLPLMRGATESLAGRMAVLQLDPLSVGEATTTAPTSVEELLPVLFGRAMRRAVPADLGDWLLTGGYPEPRTTAVDRQQWFASYFMSYLQRDLRDMLQVGDLANFQRFVRLCAARSGRLLNYSDLARDLGISVPTVKRWLSVLQASQIVHLVEPWFENYGKRVSKAPKLVFLDPGLCSWLLGLHSEPAILQGPAAGALAETAVASEWIKLLRQCNSDVRLYHWSAHSGTEVDLVLDWNGKLYGIEAKATATPMPGHADGLRKWMALAGDRAHGVVFCQVPQPVALTAGIRAVPWHLAYEPAAG